MASEREFGMGLMGGRSWCRGSSSDSIASSLGGSIVSVSIFVRMRFGRFSGVAFVVWGHGTTPTRNSYYSF